VDEVPAEAWGWMVGFYRELIDEYGWHQTPMLGFVSWLAASPYSRFLHPSKSHEALGLSAVPTYQQRLRRPMVYLVYSEPVGFVIHWQRGQGDEVREERVSSPQAPEVFGRILDWLGVPEQRHAELDAYH
jgi:hypothetical protein